MRACPGRRACALIEDTLDPYKSEVSLALCIQVHRIGLLTFWSSQLSLVLLAFPRPRSLVGALSLIGGQVLEEK